MRVRQRLQLENARARDQRADDIEIGVLGRRANQRDHTRLHVRQQRVLLGLVPAVHFIDEQDRALVVHPPAFLRLTDHPAQLGHPRQDRRDGLEVGPGVRGDHLGQRGLAGAGRAKEDDRRKQAVGFDRPPQQPPRPDDMLLPDELIQRARAHARRQRRFVFHPVIHRVGEEIHKSIRLPTFGQPA